jgi:hypothetical protein
MDQSISAVFTQCASLHQQLHIAQQVVVPITLNYNFQGPDSFDPTFIDTVAVTATGQLVYVPFHTFEVNLQIPGSGINIPIFGMVPDTLSATLQGKGAAQGPGHGGDFSAPAIHVAIAAALPFRGSNASVSVQSSATLQCNFSSPVNETTLPIELTASDSKGDFSTVILHLGAAIIVPGPIILPVTTKVQI